jgi:hypothetical protein
MNARLISYSQPVRHIHSGELGIVGLDNIQDIIAYCARVSNPSNQANTKTTSKLLEYLVKHKHWSPFEMASACIEIELRCRSFPLRRFHILKMICFTRKAAIMLSAVVASFQLTQKGFLRVHF